MMMIVGPECQSRRGRARLRSPNRHVFGDIEIERHGVAPVTRLDILLGLFVKHACFCRKKPHFCRARLPHWQRHLVRCQSLHIGV